MVAEGFLNLIQFEEGKKRPDYPKEKLYLKARE